jgi:hypothetical protein
VTDLHKSLDIGGRYHHLVNLSEEQFLKNYSEALFQEDTPPFPEGFDRDMYNRLKFRCIKNRIARLER